ncbi:class I SAM-dependent methyltransferase [bacterium]|nr:class I SAM-dependent methyltransferase [bacterium]
MTKRENQTTYFSQIADIYDGQQPLLVRKYSEKHNLIVQMIQFEKQKPFSMIDLGCGTGTLAQMILQAYPSAAVTCVDISPDMISIAQRKLAKFENRMEFIVEDLERIKFPRSYEVAVSIDAIHHLPHPQKRDLFGKLCNALTPDGIFLLADPIMIESSTLKEKNARLVKEHIQGLIKEGKVSIEEIGKRQKVKKIAEEQEIEKDHLCTFGELNEMLKDSGVGEVECFWRHFDDVIFISCKEKRVTTTESKWLEYAFEIEPKIDDVLTEGKHE